jgi:hypothetical protein
MYTVMASRDRDRFRTGKCQIGERLERFPLTVRSNHNNVLVLSAAGVSAVIPGVVLGQDTSVAQ